jgi:hypothetical protein
LETFLAREPNSGEKDQINRRVEVLKKKIAEEDAAAAAAPPAPTATGPATPPPAGNEPPAEPVSKAKRSPGPWIVIGLGGAAAIVGTIGYLSNKSKVDDLAKECGDPDTHTGCDSETVKAGNDARKQMTFSGVIFGVGIVAVGAGVVWRIIDGNRVERANEASLRRPRLAPVVGPGVAGLALSGAF